MGIRERQSRERDTVRRRILNAARMLLLSEGYASVSMRKIADQIEYSPGAIYSYFSSKEDIFLALAEEGLELLRVHCTAAAPAETPLARVREALWRFYTFSRDQPEYFSLIFVDGAVPRLGREWERFGPMRELRRDIEQDIHQCLEEGLFPGTDAPGVVFRILFTAAYGAAAFRLSRRLGPEQDADALAHDVIEAALTGLQRGLDFRLSASSNPQADLAPGEPPVLGL